MPGLLSRAGSHAMVAFLWCFHWLPLSWQAAVGRAMGAVLWRVAGSRRRITLRNLELCFPQKSGPERERIAREVFASFSRSVLERGLLWFASPARLRRLIHLEGDWQFADQHDGPVMWLVPHFVGLDVAGVAVQLNMRRARLRHGNTEIFSRAEGARPLLKAVRKGYGFFNLPDMDFGGRDAEFVPFFGVPASTLVAPSRMARSLGMTVQPVFARLLPGGQGYSVRFLPPWTDFPTDDPVADTRRMNAWIEQQVLDCPGQYFWVHKRFKTRPAGEPSLY